MRRVPAEWWDEEQTVSEIAAALQESRAVVRRRLAHLLALGLVERRRRPTISPRTEIRLVGK
jgi:predicted transcriptional regulator